MQLSEQKTEIIRIWMHMISQNSVREGNYAGDKQGRRQSEAKNCGYRLTNPGIHDII